MMPSDFEDRPSYEEYTDWYSKRFQDDLRDGLAKQWYEDVTDDSIQRLEESVFWQKLQERLSAWNESFTVIHEGFSLFGATPQPTGIKKKPFDSVLNKSFRWNVLENRTWPDPPERLQSTASKSDERYPDHPRFWSGPHNWLDTFSDIFRVRLTTTYFDGVRYLAENVKELAEQITSDPPEWQLHASHDGYHAAHLGISHRLDILDYENNDPVPVRIQLEIQVTTTIQETINELLHRVYADWRVNGRPHDWEWDHRDPAFSVNYLGSTLHYLEGMIVMARDEKRSN